MRRVSRYANPHPVGVRTLVRSRYAYDDSAMIFRAIRSSPVFVFLPRDSAADPHRVRALAELYRRRRWSATVFEVAVLPGPAYRGCFELRDASQADELEAAVEARLHSIALRLVA